MMTRKTLSETSLLPHNSDPITTVQSTIELSTRRKNTFPLDGAEAGLIGSDMNEQISGLFEPVEFGVRFGLQESQIWQSTIANRVTPRRNAGAAGRIPRSPPGAALYG